MTTTDLQKFSDLVIELRQNQAKQSDLAGSTLDLLDQLSESYMKMAQSLRAYESEVKHD